MASAVSLECPPCSSSASSRSSSTCPYSIANFVNCDNFSLRHRVFLAAVDEGVELPSFKQAMGHSGWQEAIKNEIRALEDSATWIMTTLPPGKKALGCKWVYKIKYNSTVVWSA